MISVNRQRDLILYLLNVDNYVTSKEIAQKLEISTKTVYRMITKINKEANKLIISSQRGLGYKVEDVDLLRKMINSGIMDIQFVTPVERRNRILKRLLLSSPRTITEEGLWKEYYVGYSVKSLDKKVMKSILSGFDLKLISTEAGCKIIGKELAIRKALMDLVDDKNIVDLTQVADNKNFKQKYDVNFITRQIEFIEDKLGIKIPYPYNINLFTHLYILLGRYRETRSKLTDLNANGLNNIDYSLLNISKEVINNVSTYLGVKVDSKEIYYVYEYLSSSSFNGQNVLKSVTQDGYGIKITKDLVCETYKYLGVKKYNDDAIIDKLIKHIRPLLNRLKNNIKVNNNLLEQIKLEYGDILNGVIKASKIIQEKYSLNEIDENEAGYLTLYFAQDIEENKKKINVLIMCATGIGTSQLLKIKVHNAFPDIQIVDVVGTNDLDKFKTKEVDLIISTIVPQRHISIPVVLVSSLFTSQDRTIVHRKIKEIESYE